jgi:hypothetical protein
MDELQLVRELFDEPAPPRPEVTAAARARLTARETRPGRAPRGTASPGRAHKVRRRFPMTVAAPLGAAAAVTAVAVVLASLPHGPAAPASRVGGAPPRAGQPVSGQLTSGRYWVQPGTVGNYLQVGQAGDRYVVLEKVAVQAWTPQSKKLASPSISQALSVQPASQADERAWRTAGSPASWPGTGQDTSVASPQGFTDGWLRPLEAGRGKPLAVTVGYGTAGFYWFGRQLSAPRLAAVTASPAALKQLLDEQYTSEKTPGSFASFVISALPQLMTFPVTTAVRAALYRVLAGQPGVRNLGQVSDVAGQRGIALAVDGHYSDCGSQIALVHSESGTQSAFSSCDVQEILIVNPSTWLPIALELRYTSLPPGQSWSAPDRLFSYELFGANYWTNANPPVH